MVTRKRCFDHAEVELSNNVAAILPVLESCRRLQVLVKEYLLTVLPGMRQRKHSEAGQLTPARYVSSAKRITLEDDTPWTL